MGMSFWRPPQRPRRAAGHRAAAAADVDVEAAADTEEQKEATTAAPARAVESPAERLQSRYGLVLDKSENGGKLSPLVLATPGGRAELAGVRARDRVARLLVDEERGPEGDSGKVTGGVVGSRTRSRRARSGPASRVISATASRYDVRGRSRSSSSSGLRTTRSPTCS